MHIRMFSIGHDLSGTGQLGRSKRHTYCTGYKYIKLFIYASEFAMDVHKRSF